jgi:hypothetical protein
MSGTSARWGLPLLEAGQAQKEVFHNEALTLLDLLVHTGVVATALNTPPASPGEGQAWIVGTAPDGAWTGRANQIAGWTAGGWRFVAPREGMGVWCEAQATPARWRTGAWEYGQVRAERLLVNGVPVVGAQQAAIAEPAGGTTVDARTRAAVSQILAALRAHGLIAS